MRVNSILIIMKLFHAKKFNELLFLSIKGDNCEKRLDICSNKTCSNQGKCFINGTVPTCRCFKFFSGDDCEIKSEEIKSMKQQTAVMSTLAIVIVIGFYGSIFMMDFFKYFYTDLMLRIYPK